MGELDMSEAVVTYERRDRIAEIRLHRPETLNAVSGQLLEELTEALYRFDADNEAWVAILSGEGRAFCSGVDVSQGMAEAMALGFRPGPHFNVLLSRFQNYKPVIAAVHGWAVGVGFLLALQCDLVVADETARFQITEVPLGLDGSSLWTYVSLRARGSFADELALTGRICGATEAAAEGLINRIVPSGQHVQGARLLARELLANPPLAVRAVVRSKRTQLELIATKLNIGIRNGHLAESLDFKESMAARHDKRAPIFRGE
jgi:enoyl-CoA hydratase/carnithine racemase